MNEFNGGKKLNEFMKTLKKAREEGKESFTYKSKDGTLKYYKFIETKSGMKVPRETNKNGKPINKSKKKERKKENEKKGGGKLIFEYETEYGIIKTKTTYGRTLQDGVQWIILALEDDIPNKPDPMYIKVDDQAVYKLEGETMTFIKGNNNLVSSNTHKYRLQISDKEYNLELNKKNKKKTQNRKIIFTLKTVPGRATLLTYGNTIKEALESPIVLANILGDMYIKIDNQAVYKKEGEVITFIKGNNKPVSNNEHVYLLERSDEEPSLD